MIRLTSWPVVSLIVALLLSISSKVLVENNVLVENVNRSESHELKVKDDPIVNDKSTSLDTGPKDDGHPTCDFFEKLGLSGAMNISAVRQQEICRGLTELYYARGPSPIIIGKETCEEFRMKHNGTMSIMVAGLFNSGTNAMERNLVSNLRVHGKVGAKLPWWKHNPEFLRTNVSGLAYMPEKHAHIFPIVMVKDPLFWRSSMCKKPYDLRWKERGNSGPHQEVPCPPVSRLENNTYQASPVTFHAKHLGRKEIVVRRASSFYDIWNVFNRAYLQEAPFPRLIVRFEDMLFQLDSVMDEIKDCLGGWYQHEDGIHQFQENAKNHLKGHEIGLLGAILKYSNDTLRLQNVPLDEISYATESLDHKLMNLFGYKTPLQS